MTQPMECITKIYSQLNMELSAALQTQFQLFLSSPQKKSTVRYSLEEFGLNQAQVNDAFAGYIKTFGL